MAYAGWHIIEANFPTTEQSLWDIKGRFPHPSLWQNIQEGAGSRLCLPKPPDLKTYSSLGEMHCHDVRSRKDPLEEGMATHSSILAWRIPWTEEPGRLQSMGSQRVRRDWSDLVCMRVLSSGKTTKCGQDNNLSMPFMLEHWLADGYQPAAGRHSNYHCKWEAAV